MDTGIDGHYDPENIFKKILSGAAPCVRVYEDDVVLAFMDIFPESDGHVLVIPKAEARNFLDLPPAVIGPYMERVQRIAAAVNAALAPAGIRIVQFNGAAASQSVFHVHFHIIPCHDGASPRPHGAHPAPPEVLEDFAARIRAALPS